MNVKTLVNKLKKMDPDYEVKLATDYDGIQTTHEAIESVRSDEGKVLICGDILDASDYLEI